MTTRDETCSTGQERAGRGPDLSRRAVVQAAGALAVTAAVGSAATGANRAARAQVPGTAGFVRTSDGVNLHYLSSRGPADRS